MSGAGDTPPSCTPSDSSLGVRWIHGDVHTPVSFTRGPRKGEIPVELNTFIAGIWSTALSTSSDVMSEQTC